MGEETGRKSPLRHAKTIVFLAVILAISLAPAIALRFFPREALVYVLAPVWSTIGARTGFSTESVASVWIMASFVLATVAASALLLVMGRSLTRSEGRNS
jgi:hypothetical protein